MATVSDALALALKHHQAGDLRRAEQIYRDIVQVEPEQPVALHFLGVILLQRGQLGEAAEHIRRALSLAPGYAAAHANLGSVFQAQGRFVQAEKSCRRALEIDPGNAIAHNNLGNALLEQGNLEGAVASYRRALEIQPDHAEAHANLGNALRRQGKLAAAVASYRRAVEIKPDYAEALSNLGNVLRKQGEVDEAVDLLRRALQISPRLAEAHNNLGAALAERGQLEEAAASIQEAQRIDPNYVEAHANLGMVLRGQERLEEAVASYRRALQIHPNCAQAHVGLGVALRALGNLAQAAECYERALELDPDSAEAHASLGNVLMERKNLAEAIARYRRALELDPDSANTHANLGHALNLQGRVEEAAQSYRSACQLDPGQPLRRLHALALCPTVFESKQAIDRYRQKLLSDLGALSPIDLQRHLPELNVLGCEPPFNLPFHGCDDRPVKEAYAGVFSSPDAESTRVPNEGPLRVGFVVTRIHEGAFLRCMGEILARMRRDPFELVVVCSRRGRARIAGGLDSESVGILTLPERFDRVVETIRAARFDLLYHWEVGTDPTNYFLPFFRLAPVQCTSWGFPVTSGIPHMDCYLSSALIEEAGADSHYSETLLRTSTLLTYQRRVSLPGPSPRREDFGFAPQQHIYLCAQRLGKFHPDFDSLLAGILRRDELGLIAGLEDPHGHAASLLRDRLAATIPDVAERIVLLPRQAYPDYIRLMAAADVLLDPPHYGGGLSTYDAFSINKPVVTWPSRFSRGRHTLGCYRKMGIDDCVASDLEAYVRIAVRLGTDSEYRAEVEARLRDRSDSLFEDEEAVREHERLFRELGEQARSRLD